MQVSLSLEDVADVVANQIHAAVSPLLAEIKALSSDLAAARAEAALVKADASDLAARLAAIPQPVDPAPIVDRAVAEAVAQIPVPKDGRDADVGAVVAQVQAALVPTIDRAVEETVQGRIAALPALPTAEDVARMVHDAVSGIPMPKDGEPGAPGQPGEPGKSVDEEALIARLIGHMDASIDLAVDDVRKTVDGRVGEMTDLAEHRIREAVSDLVTETVGKSMNLCDADIQDRMQKLATSVALELRGDLAREVEAKVGVVREELRAEAVNLSEAAAADAVKAAIPDLGLEAKIEAVVERAIAELPPAPPGKDGADADMVALAARIDEDVAEAVQKAMAALPVAKDGADGRDGADGIGAAAALIDQDGSLVMTMTDGSVHRLGRVVGRDVDMHEVKDLVSSAVAALPVPKDGRDGLGFDDLDVQFDGQRKITLSFVRGEQTKSFDIVLPHMVYRGVWSKSDPHYVPGDVVTWGGSAWVCTGTNDVQPGNGDGWQLAVKRGRDAGAPVVAKERPPQGPVKAAP